jgi:hypothetical protein
MLFVRFIVTHDGEDAAMKHEESGPDDREYQCLIRATNGKDVNFSTQVKILPTFTYPSFTDKLLFFVSTG